jgi:hypothetical protein
MDECTMPKYKNPGKVQFQTEIIEHDGGGAYVEFPHDVNEMFGVKGRVPVKAKFDGVDYRGSLMKMGADCHILGVLKEIRNKIGKGPGDTCTVIVELDTEERKIELADDVAKVLQKNKVANDNWNKLSYSHQREYHLWIDESKRPETRAKRIEQMIEKLKANQKLK